jgi:hypothetical protein
VQAHRTYGKIADDLESKYLALLSETSAAPQPRSDAAF